MAGSDEATALGNALVQAMAAGDMRELIDLRHIVACSFDLTTYEPIRAADSEHRAECYVAICC